MSGLAREREAELMDRPDADHTELNRSLADLRHANRWLGGTRTVLRLISPLMRGRAGRPARLLDVATGSADIPVAISRWAWRNGVRVEVTAVDIHPTTLAAARLHTAARSDVVVLAADALSLPFADGTFDVTLCSTALHHFSEPDAVAVLRELARVSARAVVVLDLRRSRPALAAVSLMARTIWRRHPITRHDGPVSVRAAFTPAELRRLAAAAGLEGAEVREHLWFRQSLVYRHAEGTG